MKFPIGENTLEKNPSIGENTVVTPDLIEPARFTPRRSAFEKLFILRRVAFKKFAYLRYIYFLI